MQTLRATCIPPPPSAELFTSGQVVGAQMVEGRLPEQVTSVTQHDGGGCRTHGSPSKAPGTASASLGSCPHAPPQTQAFEMQELNVSTGHAYLCWTCLQWHAHPHCTILTHLHYFPFCKTQNLGLWSGPCTLVTSVGVSVHSSDQNVAQRGWAPMEAEESPSILMSNRLSRMSIALKINVLPCIWTYMAILASTFCFISHIPSLCLPGGIMFLLFVSCCILIKEAPPLMSLISSSPAV